MFIGLDIGTSSVKAILLDENQDLWPPQRQS
jgi:sugar (pentulose or hexulose) kinase